MSVEVHIEESWNNAQAHAQDVQRKLNDGWEIVSHQVLRTVNPVDFIYTTMLKRESAKNRVEGAALREVVERNARDIQRIKTRLQVLEDTLDDDTQENDAVFDLVEGDWRSQIVHEAILEDEEMGR